LLAAVRADLSASFEGDLAGSSSRRIVWVGVTKRADQDLTYKVVATLRQREHDLQRRSAIPLRGVAYPTPGSDGGVEVGVEKPALDQLVEVEGGQLGRDADLFGRLLAGYGLFAAADELVEAAADVVGEETQYAQRPLVVHRARISPIPLDGKH